MFFECFMQFKEIINIIIFIEIFVTFYIFNEIETFDFKFFKTLYIFVFILIVTSLKRKNFI